MIDAARWKRARELFDAVVALTPPDRAQRLTEACGEDVELRREIESLLAFDRRSHDPIAQIVADAALDASANGTASDDEAIPASIGRYRVIEKIAEGGMGRVFLAEDAALGRRVAVKVPAFLSDNPTIQARLRHEARVAATLNHPHVCIVHEVGEGPDGRPFIAMELVEGETLAVRLARGPLPIGEVLTIGRQAADALQAAHDKGIVHRDLKPSNIMLTAHGIKLLDFGLASVARDASTLPRGDGLMGTVPYMSPEQVRSEPLDHRTDLFSLGSVLYEAATGHLPFGGVSTNEMCDAIEHRASPRLREHVSSLPGELDAVVARALAKRREDRYQRASDLVRDLDACATSLPATAGVRSSRRTRALWLASAAVLVASIAAALISLRSTSVQRPPSAVDRDDIPTITTASPDALKAYTLGMQQASAGNYRLALSLFEQAVQLDPELAIAYQWIARQRSNLAFTQPQVDEAATRAFELRGGVTPQERFSIEAFYHSSVTGDLTRAIQVGSEWAAAFPNDWRPHHALGDLYVTTFQYEQAAASERATLRLNADMASAYSNLAGALFALDRFDEARSIYRTAMARGLDAPEYHAYLWRIAYYLGDQGGMRRELEWAAATSSWSANMPALAAGLQGQWHDALRLASQARDGFERRQMPGLVALSWRYEALTSALIGDCRPDRLDAAQTANASQSIENWGRVIVAMGLCGRGAEVRPAVDRMALERPNDTLLINLYLPLVRAASVMDRSPSEVFEALPDDNGFELGAESLPLYLRGLALLRLGRGLDARRAFERIVERRGNTHWFPVHPLAQLGVARASALAGDVAGAARAYEQFFRLWPRADEDLPAMVSARREYRELHANMTTR